MTRRRSSSVPLPRTRSRLTPQPRFKSQSPPPKQQQQAEANTQVTNGLAASGDMSREASKAKPTKGPKAAATNTSGVEGGQGNNKKSSSKPKGSALTDAKKMVSTSTNASKKPANSSGRAAGSKTTTGRVTKLTAQDKAQTKLYADMTASIASLLAGDPAMQQELVKPVLDDLRNAGKKLKELAKAKVGRSVRGVIEDDEDEHDADEPDSPPKGSGRRTRK